MSTELTNKDYKSILKFYKKDIPKSKLLLKKQAEDILSDKLCKCIKKLDPVHEAKSIGICTKSIFINKKLKRGKFNCNGKRSVKISKYIGSITKKHRKHME
jgi:hypothetical protein